jgi:hypothetical protein
MSRHSLTVRKINSRKLKAGKQVDHPVKVAPGLALPVTDTGHKSFVLVARYPLHLRRTVRTHRSPLSVEDTVRELVIAHARPGLHKVYDQAAYLIEKRRCLDLWEKRFLAVVAPLPDVTDLTDERAKRAAS